MSAAWIGTWIALAPVMAASPTTPNRVLKADCVEACSCDLACPSCSEALPRGGYCKGASLVEIREGHYGPVDLAGVTVLAAYDGGNRIKFLVSENATRARTDAVVELPPTAEGFFEAPVLEVRNQTITVKRARDTVKVSTAGTPLELEQIRNSEGGPIKFRASPHTVFPAFPVSTLRNTKPSPCLTTATRSRSVFLEPKGTRQGSTLPTIRLRSDPRVSGF